MRSIPAQQVPEIHPNKKKQREDQIIDHALEIIYKRLQRPIIEGEAHLASIVTFLKMLLAEEEREVFLAIYLNTQLEIISVEELFKGTLWESSVHPRELVKSAIKINAASVVIAHNHTGGVCRPSQSDQRITRKRVYGKPLPPVHQPQLLSIW